MLFLDVSLSGEDVYEAGVGLPRKCGLEQRLRGGFFQQI